MKDVSIEISSNTNHVMPNTERSKLYKALTGDHQIVNSNQTQNESTQRNHLQPQSLRSSRKMVVNASSLVKDEHQLRFPAAQRQPFCVTGASIQKTWKPQHITPKHVFVKSELIEHSQQPLLVRKEMYDFCENENGEPLHQENAVIVQNNLFKESIVTRGSLPCIVSHSTKLFDIGYEYESNSDASSTAYSEEEQYYGRYSRLRRSESDDGQYPVSMYVDQDDGVPLDLSKKSDSLPNVPDSVVPALQVMPSISLLTSTLPAEKHSIPSKGLMLLADACIAVENDAQSSNCSTVSSPESLSDSNSTHSIGLEDKTNDDDCVSSNDSHEYFNGTSEASLDGCQIKCEIGETFRLDEGIVLNSNVVGGNVYEVFPFTSVHVNNFCPEEKMLSDVSNLHVHDGQEYSISGSNSPSLMDDDCVWEFPELSAIESKRRLRLAKSEYESMSEEDRRVRHRVLDNQRSKQYRERRRKMVSTLNQQIGSLENDNKSLRDILRTLEKRRVLIQSILQRTNPEGLSVQMQHNSFYVKSEC